MSSGIVTRFRWLLERAANSLLYHQCFIAGDKPCANCDLRRDIEDALKESSRDELQEIDSLLHDASWSFAESEVEHQIAMHAETLPEFTKTLAAHLRKIDAVGKARRDAQMEHL